MSEIELLKAAGLICDSACQPEIWPHCMEVLAARLGAKGAQFVECDINTLMVYETIIVGYPRELAELYNNLYVRLDPRAPYFFANLGKAVSSADACPSQNFKASQVYKELLAPFGAEEIMLMSAADGDTCAFLGLIRPEASGPFTQADVDAFSIVLPYFQRAFRIRRMLAAHRSMTTRLTEAALDALTLGVVLIGDSGRILFANRRAKNMAASNDGLVMREGKLCASAERENQILLAQIAAAVDPACRAQMGPGKGMRISRKSMKTPYTLLTAPLSSHPEGMSAEAAAIVFISDPDADPPSAEKVLMEWYGMTASEARLAGAMLTGKSLEELSVDFGVSMPTLRSQLSAIFGKTNTKRQSDLVRLLSMQLGPIGHK
ncbi:MAG: helix-turn-helix transcriptional regulator [Alphaproteobacteria bacterium]|nr:helix-turn-helix transcriptional regulator [Alphaproteobacteria bacterium]